MDSGIYQAMKDHLIPVKFIRFSKQFTTSFGVAMRERTVFVVHTSALREVLMSLAHVSASLLSGKALAS